MWVVDTESNEPVQGATVTVWELTETYQLSTSGVVQAATGTTDADGLISLTPATTVSGSSFAVSVEVDARDELLLLTDVPRPQSTSAARAIFRVVSDRSYYKAGEEMHVKGWLRMQADGASTLSVPDATVMATEPLSFQITWDDGAEATIVLAEVGPEGSFDVTLQVPGEGAVRAGSHTLQLGQEPSWWSLVADAEADWPGMSEYGWGGRVAVDFVVADARPPTVEMVAEAPEGVLMAPGGSTSLRLETSTLSGVPVGSAKVQLTWSLVKSSPPPTWRSPWYRGDAAVVSSSGLEDDVGGIEELVTGEDGTLSWAFRPHNLTGEAVGDTLSLSFQWVGPTREVVTQRLQLVVALAPQDLSLSAPAQVRCGLPSSLVPLGFTPCVPALPSLAGPFAAARVRAERQPHATCRPRRGPAGLGFPRVLAPRRPGRRRRVRRLHQPASRAAPRLHRRR